MPLDTSTIVAITPLGQVSPPGHTQPTDHICVSFVDPWNGQQQFNNCSPRPVRAAGSGVITFTCITEPSGGDTKVDIQMTKSFHYYDDHVRLKPGMVPGARVNAGDTIATTTGRCPSIARSAAARHARPAIRRRSGDDGRRQRTRRISDAGLQR